MKQLEVQIMGQSYLLACTEGGDSRLLEAVEQVDAAMCKIRAAGKVKARERIAVLAALNIAFDLADKSTSPVRATNSKAAALAPAAAISGTPPTDFSDPQLSSLINRLDAALSQDGRLL